MTLFDTVEDVNENQLSFEDVLRQPQKDAVKRDYRNTTVMEGDFFKLRDIAKHKGGISVNDFTSADRKATESWARSFWQELNVKSPYFRAFFGDWREHSTEPVKIVTQKGNARGNHVNVDTGWDISIGKKLFDETLTHGSKTTRDARPLLAYINEIVENAILVDSKVSTKETDSRKTTFSTFFHTMYSLVDDGENMNLIKLTVEQSDDYIGNNLTRRAYKLNNMERTSLGVTALQADHTSKVLDYSISDLFKSVKRIDKSFNPKPASKVVNDDGTPRIVYHGTDAQFNAFDMTKGRANMDIQGAFFSPWEEDARGYGKNVRAFYLSIKNPASEQTAYRALRLFQGQNEAGIKAKAWLESQGYDGVNNENEEYIAFHPEQIKSATDNIGLFDSNNPNIQYSLRYGVYIDPDNIEKNMDIVRGMDAVAELKGDEVMIGNSDLRQTISTFFDNAGNNAKNKELGNVALNWRGIKDDLAHGITQEKAVSFFAVPQVIEEGRIIDYRQNWKNRGYDTAIIAAPIVIGEQEYNAGVIIMRNSDTQRFYVHDVDAIRKGNVAVQTGDLGETETLPGGDTYPSLRSILSKLQDVNPQFSSRQTDPATDRQLLAEAFDSVAETPLEKEKLAQYKAHIDALNKDAERLDAVNAEIRALSFAPGKRDTGKLTALRNQQTILQKRIARQDKTLLSFERSTPLKPILEDEHMKYYERIETLKALIFLDRMKERPICGRPRFVSQPVY